MSVIFLFLAAVDGGVQSYLFLADAGLVGGEGGDLSFLVIGFWLFLFVGAMRIGFGLRNPCLGQSLAAGIVGVTLILLEAVVEIFITQDGIGFHLEELLLASGGLNMLMEEARLSEEYRDLLIRRQKAAKETEKLIDDVGGFRKRIVAVAKSTFERPTDGS